MQILLTTFGFFLIFSIYAYGNFQKLKDLVITESLYTAYIKNCVDDRTDEIEKRAKVVYRRLAPKEDIEGKQRQFSKKLTRKLHISSLFKKDNEVAEKEKEAILSVFKRLLVELYGNEDFFRDARKIDPNVVDSLLEKVIAKVKDVENETVLKEAKELANIELNNGFLQNVLYKMLKGSQAEKKDKKEKLQGYPSLLDFISLQKRKEMASLYLAPRPLLKAIFLNDKTVDEVIKERKAIYLQLDSEKDDKNKSVDLKTTLTDSFRNKFTNYLPSEINNSFIDFNISKTVPRS